MGAEGSAMLSPQGAGDMLSTVAPSPIPKRVRGKWLGAAGQPGAGQKGCRDIRCLFHRMRLQGAEAEGHRAQGAASPNGCRGRWGGRAGAAGKAHEG